MIQTGELRAPWRPHYGLSKLKRNLLAGGDADFFPWSDNERTGWNGFNLKGERVMLDVRKKFLLKNMARYWNRLNREAVDVPYLGTT